MSDANLQPRDDLLRAREELRQRAERALGQGRWRRWRPVLDLTLLAAFVVLLTALLAPPPLRNSVKLVVRFTASRPPARMSMLNPTDPAPETLRSRWRSVFVVAVVVPRVSAPESSSMFEYC